MSIRASCINPFPKLNWGKMRKAWLSCLKMFWMSCSKKRVWLGKVVGRSRAGMKQTRQYIFVIIFTAYICSSHTAATFFHNNESAIVCYARRALQDGPLFSVIVAVCDFKAALIINGHAGRKSGSHNSDRLWGLPTGEIPKVMQWLVNYRTYVSSGYYKCFGMQGINANLYIARRNLSQEV